MEWPIDVPLSFSSSLKRINFFKKKKKQAKEIVKIRVEIKYKIEKINIKSCCFEMINKTDRLLARLKDKKKKTQITKIINKMSYTYIKKKNYKGIICQKIR